MRISPLQFGLQRVVGAHAAIVDLADAAEVREGVEGVGVGARSPQTWGRVRCAVQLQVAGYIAHVADGGGKVGRNRLLHPEAVVHRVGRLYVWIDGMETRLGDEG